MFAATQSRAGYGCAQGRSLSSHKTTLVCARARFREGGRRCLRSSPCKIQARGLRVWGRRIDWQRPSSRCRVVVIGAKGENSSSDFLHGFTASSGPPACIISSRAFPVGWIIEQGQSNDPRMGFLQLRTEGFILPVLNWTRVFGLAGGSSGFSICFSVAR